MALRVDVEPKKVVTFKPGKEMEERVRKYAHIPGPEEKQETVVLGADETDGHADPLAAAKTGNRPRKLP